MRKNETLIPLGPLARHLRVPTAWLREEARAGRIPCLLAGSAFLFDAEAVAKVLIERAQKPHTEATHAT